MDIPWVGRVLEAFARALDSEEARRVGVCYNVMWDQMVEPRSSTLDRVARALGFEFDV